MRGGYRAPTRRCHWQEEALVAMTSFGYPGDAGKAGRGDGLSNDSRAQGMR